MQQPLVSIIVPIYNVEKFLRQCLDSIVNQTYSNLEIILVDDGSPDNCGAICDEYAAKDDRIAVIHKENEGVSAARNDGIERATGEWVMFVDPDDWLEIDCCSEVMKKVKKIDAELIYFQRYVNYEDGKLLKKFPPIGSRQLSRDDLQTLQFDALADYVVSFGFESTAPWSKFYRRSFLIKNSCRFPLQIKRRQDVLFNLYCLEYLEKAYYYDYAGYHYRQNDNSICCRFNRNMLDILLAFYTEAEEFVIKYHQGNQCYERMLGVLAIKLQGDLRNTMFFNAVGFMPVNEYLNYMEAFYANPVIKKYLDKPNVSDFRTFGEKILYILISRQHVYIYYYLCASVKLFKSLIKFIKKAL